MGTGNERPYSHRAGPGDDRLTEQQNAGGAPDDRSVRWPSNGIHALGLGRSDNRVVRNCQEPNPSPLLTRRQRASAVGKAEGQSIPAIPTPAPPSPTVDRAGTAMSQQPRPTKVLRLIEHLRQPITVRTFLRLAEGRLSTLRLPSGQPPRTFPPALAVAGRSFSRISRLGFSVLVRCEQRCERAGHERCIERWVESTLGEATRRHGQDNHRTNRAGGPSSISCVLIC